jgi:hypothetical protein
MLRLVWVRSDDPADNCTEGETENAERNTIEKRTLCRRDDEP